MSKTLLFATSYCKTLQEWDERIYKWFTYFSNSSLQYSKLLIIDDGSPVLPTYNLLPCVSDKFTIEPEHKNFIYCFKDNLGRPAHLDYPGWFRGFSFAAKYAYKFNYDKIIHVESDAYILSKKLIEDFNNKTSGWAALWCHRHQFPETAIQIICKDQIANYFAVTQLPYGKYFKDRTIETCLPFTSIDRNYIGDRYQEYRDDIPANADYACQVNHSYII